MNNHFRIYGFEYVCIVVLVVFILLIDLLYQRSCNNYKEITGRDSKYVFMDACYVQNEEGKWIRYDKNFKE